ncbi:MAG: 16S rRNA (cytosine(1402)-N(4))-methyltransferase RsmH [Alphaproteobacteria bacterium]
MTDVRRSGGRHRPVMLRQVLAALAPRDGGIYVDGTFGAGGYSRALLEAARCTVWGIDRDPAAVTGAERLVREFAGRLTVLAGRYGEMDRLLAARGVRAAHGVALDLGVSSLQLDDPARGFSFRHDGPLDMRMNGAGPTAADVVNTSEEGALAALISELGEERRARRIARAIVKARAKRPITRTGELAAIVRPVVPAAADGIDPATRTFQALRIHVNDELGELDRGLGAAERLLAPGGRVAVVSFHSLEDRKVKRFLAARSGRQPHPSRPAPPAADGGAPTFRLIAKRALRPAADEVAANPRARSARLRAAERTAALAREAAA